MNRRSVSTASPTIAYHTEVFPAAYVSYASPPSGGAPTGAYTTMVMR